MLTLRTVKPVSGEEKRLIVDGVWLQAIFLVNYLDIGKESLRRERRTNEF